MKAANYQERKRNLQHIGAACKQWRLNQGLRLCDVASYGLSIQSISNFEYGLNDSVLALYCYVKRGFKGAVDNAP